MPDTPKSTSDHHHAILEQFQYQVKKFLGCGGGGHVYLAYDVRKKHRQVAVKVVRQNNPLGEGEWRYWSRLHHPNMIHLLEKFEVDGDRYYIMEYAANGTLFEWLKRNKAKDGLPKTNEQRGKRWVRQLLEAMRYCHHQGLYHFDIKSSNILLDSNLNIKLSDFGTMKSMEEDNVRHNGCRFYRPPEVLRSVRLKGPESFEAVDVWAMGATLLRVFSGGKLISYKDFSNCDSENKIDILRNIRNNIDKVPAIPLAIEGVRDLLLQMLQMDPRRRPSCSQALKAPWLTIVVKKVSKGSAVPTPTGVKASSASPSPGVREIGVSEQRKSSDLLLVQGILGSSSAIGDKLKLRKSALMNSEQQPPQQQAPEPEWKKSITAIPPANIASSPATSKAKNRSSHVQNSTALAGEPYDGRAHEHGRHRRKTGNAKLANNISQPANAESKSPRAIHRIKQESGARPKMNDASAQKDAIHESPSGRLAHAPSLPVPMGYIVNSARVAHGPVQLQTHMHKSKASMLNEKMISHVMPAMTALLYSNSQEGKPSNTAAHATPSQSSTVAPPNTDADTTRFNEMVAWVLSTMGAGTAGFGSVSSLEASSCGPLMLPSADTGSDSPQARASHSTVKSFVQKSSMVMENPSYVTKTHVQLHVMEGRHEEHVGSSASQPNGASLQQLQPVTPPTNHKKKSRNREKSRKRSSSRSRRHSKTTVAAKDPGDTTTDQENPDHDRRRSSGKPRRRKRTPKPTDTSDSTLKL